MFLTSLLWTDCIPSHEIGKDYWELSMHGQQPPCPLKEKKRSRKIYIPIKRKGKLIKAFT